jgi:short subunit dehydrogenase-like uncharacterized protein
MSKRHDLVLFGATGYTGKLVADYLARKKPELRIALAGRDRAKLEAVRAELGLEWPIEIADALDAGQVGVLVKSTRVVCTTVGPYSRYGGPLVATCADNGVDYCDLTGETPFMKESIDANHERARTTGARIVHACGFDSIPSDLGVFVVHRLAKERGKKLGLTRLRFTKIKGRVSGGTAASAFAVVERARDSKVRRVLGNPHALDPAGFPHASTVRDGRFPTFDEASGHWTGPFFMAPVNTRVVRRSNGLMDGAYGERFAYDEVVDTGPGARGWFYAARQSALMIGLVGTLVTPGGAAVLERFAPKPGEGPTPEQRARGSFRGEIDAITDEPAPQHIRGVVAGVSDPGYGETSKMLAESALCLAQDSIPREGGVLTPASCMGAHLVKRLRDAEMTFSAEWA